MLQNVIVSGRRLRIIDAVLEDQTEDEITSAVITLTKISEVFIACRDEG